MFDSSEGAPFVVLMRDVWLVDPASAKGSPDPDVLAARLAARRVFGQDAMPDGFAAYPHIKGEWDWTAEFPTIAPHTLHVVIEPPGKTGSYAFFAGWTAECTAGGPPAPLRSPESFRMAFAQMIPTYREEFKRECLYRHRVRAQAAERERRGQ